MVSICVVGAAHHAHGDLWTSSGRSTSDIGDVVPLFVSGAQTATGNYSPLTVFQSMFKNLLGEMGKVALIGIAAKINVIVLRYLASV